MTDTTVISSQNEVQLQSKLYETIQDVVALVGMLGLSVPLGIVNNEQRIASVGAIIIAIGMSIYDHFRTNNKITSLNRKG